MHHVLYDYYFSYQQVGNNGGSGASPNGLINDSFIKIT